tara:strand:- start:100 stop:366 length:267 start_codon:yes stop_codon:yes gene_type:complete
MNDTEIALTTGAPLKLDGDLDALIETLYEEILVKNSYRSGFNDIASEISFVLSQMTTEDKERYLFISLGVLINRFHQEIYGGLEEKGE